MPAEFSNKIVGITYTGEKPGRSPAFELRAHARRGVGPVGEAEFA
jgi:hypothetical protein